MKTKISIGIKCIVFAFLLLIMNLFGQSAEASDDTEGLVRSGDIIPAFSVPVPENKAYRSYLDLKKGGSFQPAEMDVKMLIIEVLNVY